MIFKNESYKEGGLLVIEWIYKLEVGNIVSQKGEGGII
jgi:hypothetical protein